MTKILHSKTKQRIRVSGYTREEIYNLITKWWQKKRVEKIKLANDVRAILCIANGEMLMVLKTHGITLHTENTISIHPNPDFLTVQINTYKPSSLLQCIWNVTIRYEYIEGQFLKITYEKRVSSCAPQGLDWLILYLTTEQHQLDTFIMAKNEAKNMLNLLSNKTKK